jgi:hypothetical protein
MVQMVRIVRMVQSSKICSTLPPSLVVRAVVGERGEDGDGGVASHGAEAIDDANVRSRSGGLKLRLEIL